MFKLWHRRPGQPGVDGWEIVRSRLFTAEGTMPRFFIDTEDGEFSHQDDEGYDLPDREAARQAAVSALPDMARQKLPDGDRRTFAARVRDENGRVIYVATLTLVGEWWIPISS